MKSFLQTLLFSLCILIALPDTAQADVVWKWQFANEAGTFTTDGTVQDLNGPHTFTMLGFTVTASDTPANVGASYALNGPPQGVIWDATTITQFFRFGGSATNGANFRNTASNWFYGMTPGVGELDNAADDTVALGALKVAPDRPTGFAPAREFDAGGAQESLAIADFDGDGNLDIAVGEAGTGVRVLSGDGAGGFVLDSHIDSSAGSGNQLFGLTAADFNGDGHPDTAVVLHEDNKVFVSFNDGSGQFGSSGNTLDSGAQPVDLISVDVNADGKADLVSANENGNSITLELGAGGGGFSPAVDFSTDSTPEAVASGDFNGDGDIDLASGNLNGGNVSVLLGDGAGNFAAAMNFPAGPRPIAITSADFNEDGKADLAVTNQNSLTISVLAGDGTGQFAAPVTFPAGKDIRTMAQADFNGDGHTDLVLGTQDDSAINLLLGDGAGGFAAPAIFASAPNIEDLKVGDFNADGRPDVAVAGTWDGKVRVFLNQFPGDPLPPGISGLWFDPALDGEGYNLISTPSGSVVFYYYGHDSSGERLWLISDVLPQAPSLGIPLTLNMFQGGYSGTFASPEPSATALSPWGSMTVTFDSCTSGQVVLSFDSGTKTSNVTHLAGINGVACGIVASALQATTPTLQSVPTPLGVSGLWFDPTLEGEGYNLIEAPSGTIAYFYGYDVGGGRLWLISDLIPGDMTFNTPTTVNLLRAQPGTFDVPNPTLDVWGTLQMTFTDCSHASFVIDGPGSASKTANVTLLAGIKNAACVNP